MICLRIHHGLPKPHRDAESYKEEEVRKRHHFLRTINEGDDLFCLQLIGI